MRDSRLRLIFGDPEAGSAFELSGLDFTTDRFANGKPFRLEGNGRLRLASSRANHIDAGKAAFVFEAGLGKISCRGASGPTAGSPGCSVRSAGSRSMTARWELAFHGRQGDGRLALEKLTLVQSQGGKVQSEVELSGEVGYQPFEIRADVDIRRLSEEVTSLLFDLGFGFNPGRAVVQYRGDFSYAKRRLAATGTLRADRTGDAIFDLERIALPPLRLEGEYDFAVDLEESSIDLRKFALTLNEKESESASFRLRRPIRYSWREGAESTDQRATFDLECSAFDPEAAALPDSGRLGVSIRFGLLHIAHAADLAAQPLLVFTARQRADQQQLVSLGRAEIRTGRDPGRARCRNPAGFPLESAESLPCAQKPRRRSRKRKFFGRRRADRPGRENSPAGSNG